jgi:hypothetical protein
MLSERFWNWSSSSSWVCWAYCVTSWKLWGLVSPDSTAGSKESGKNGKLHFVFVVFILLIID